MERTQVNRVSVHYVRQCCDNSHACGRLLLIELGANSRRILGVLDHLHSYPRYRCLHFTDSSRLNRLNRGTDYTAGIRVTASPNGHDELLSVAPMRRRCPRRRRDESDCWVMPSSSAISSSDAPRGVSK